MHRSALVFVPAALALILACEPADPGNNDDGGDPVPVEPDPAHFGLKHGRCFTYVGDRGWEQYSLEIRLDEVTVAARTTYAMVWSQPIGMQRTDYVEVLEDRIVLHQRNVQNATVARYDPPAGLVRKNMAAGTDLETATTARVSGSGSAVNESQTFVTVAEELDVVQAAGEVVDAMRLLMAVHRDGGPSGSERWWFTPGLGLSRVDFDDGEGPLDLARNFDVSESQPCYPE